MNKQSIIGLILMFLVLLGFSYWQTSKITEQKQAEAARLAQESMTTQSSLSGTDEEQDTISGSTTGKAVRKVDTGNPFVLSLDGQQNYYQIENDVFTVTFNNKGGRIAGISLKEYKTYLHEDLILMNENLSDFYLQFFAANRSIQTDHYFFEYIAPETTKVSGNDSVVARMRLYASQTADSGLVPDKNRYLEFVYTIRGNEYMMGFDVNFVNTHDIIAQNTRFIDLVWKARLQRFEKALNMESMNTAVYYKPINDKVDYLKETRDDDDNLTTPTKWISFKQQFFSATLIADNDFSSAEIRNFTRKNAPESYLKDLEATIGLPYNGEAQETIGMNIYAGPNKFRIMRDYGLDLERQIPLGWTFFLMQWINRVAVIPIFDFLESHGLGYGLIILILTILLKIVISPLTIKSYISSAKMRVIAPEINELNKKYPKPEQAMDKQKAMMNLYRRAGVSPMSGCIPVLLQFPILLAMYRFFPASIELRQQPFLWADDLSSYDSILNLPFNIPFYGNHVSLFALLMALANLFYTRMTMKQQAGSNTMPGMKFMMYFMPFMLLFYFNSYSSALSYYYFLSTIITFLQMYIIRLMINDQKVLARLEETRKKPVKKSKFQKRLEEMARKQQEIARQQQAQRRR